MIKNRLRAYTKPKKIKILLQPYASISPYFIYRKPSSSLCFLYTSAIDYSALSHKSTSLNQIIVYVYEQREFSIFFTHVNLLYFLWKNRAHSAELVMVFTKEPMFISIVLGVIEWRELRLAMGFGDDGQFAGILGELFLALLLTLLQIVLFLKLLHGKYLL